jgi:cytochrome c-type biogenesis protein CcmE
VDVVVEGRMGEDGTFHATTLLAKCASRYENAPSGSPPGSGADKYRATPGYKAGAKA